MNINRFENLLLHAVVCTSLSVVAFGDDRVTRAAEGVASRLLGSESPGIQWETIPTREGRDVYATVCENGKLVIKGSSSVALCRGLHDYLRKNQLGMVGWEGPRFRIPKSWPDAPRTRVETPCRIRHCYNVVTAGYTFPYWTWERWEQELDWLAMHGYNMIMAPVATEAIATRVWKGLGFTQEEIDPFYVGPAHLPWQRMGNIQNVGGTLPPDWHRDQIALQHKLLKRMRELGIEPVVQSFAGFVPEAIHRRYPDVKTTETLWNSGFGEHQRPTLILPGQPMYQTISQAYIQEWKKEFGDANYYLVDSFNELKNLSPDAAMCAKFGEETLAGVKAGDPDGKWVIGGWLFSYHRKVWTPENVKALFSSVPADQVLILDYANDYRRGWDHFEGFYGKPYLMGYVPNMGGKTAFTGHFNSYATGVSEMVDSPWSESCQGFTLSGEGLENNQALYELLSDTAWSHEAVDPEQWVEDYCKSRYGSCPDSIKQAWSCYLQTCYGTFHPHPKFGWQSMRCRHGSVNRDPRFTEGVMSFLEARDTLHDSASYQDDALEMAAITLSLKADEWFLKAKEMNDASDIAGLDKAAARGLEILLEIDRLLESHSLHRLAPWIDMARQHSDDDKLNDSYESNARRILTVWGPPVNDYAARMWSGLIRDFYHPRMKAYLDGMKGNGLDRATWENTWVTSTGISKIEPYPNPVEMAAKLVAKAHAEQLPDSPAPSDAQILGNWTPEQTPFEWKNVRWDLPRDQLKNFIGVRFIYTKGKHRLDIKSVSLFADGNEVATETHDGRAGTKHTRNTYILKLPKTINANNECYIQAMVRGGVSFGQVQLITR